MGQVEGLLARRARERPGDPAYLCGADGRSLTWRDLAHYAASLRQVARERRLPPRSRIAIRAEDPLAFAPAYLGVIAAGHTAVPLDPRLTAGEMTAATARLLVDVLLTDRPQEVDHLRGVELWAATTDGPVALRPGARNGLSGNGLSGNGLSGNGLSGNGLAGNGLSGNRLPSAGAAMRPAVLLSSSGTTGRPKGIGLTEWQLLHAARRVARHHEFGPGERGYSPLPLFHVNAQVMGLLATLVSGASLVLDRRFERDAYWERVARWQPTWLNAVPAVLATLAATPPPPEALAARIRFARSASAPLPVVTERAFAEATGVTILQTYGMTEAAGQITANPIDAAARHEGSVGLPVGIGLRVLGPDGSPVAAGEMGMVALRGRQVAATYLYGDGGHESTRPARDERGWLHTGDLGTVDAEGFVHLAGRADDVINRGGEKVFPQEVENVLLGHPAVRSAAVVAAPHQRLGEVPVALVTADFADTADEAALIAALHELCERRLARWKWPNRIEVAAALPTGPTGKVLRRLVRAELTAR